MGGAATHPSGGIQGCPPRQLDPAPIEMPGAPALLPAPPRKYVSTDQHENRYSLAIYAPVSAKDFKLSVRFKIMKGAMQAAGIAARFLDVDSYYVVSASALEERVDLFRIVKGKKERIWGTDADVVRDRWHLLELQVNDDQFTISLDRN
jgi:hypothetical protein